MSSNDENTISGGSNNLIGEAASHIVITGVSENTVLAMITSYPIVLVVILVEPEKEIRHPRKRRYFDKKRTDLDAIV